MKEKGQGYRPDNNPSFLSRQWVKQLLENPKAVGGVTLVLSPILLVTFGVIVSNDAVTATGAALGIVEAGIIRGLTRRFRRERMLGWSDETAGGFIGKILGPPFYHPQGYK